MSIIFPSSKKQPVKKGKRFRKLLMNKYKEDQYRIAYEDHAGRCVNCGERATQIAHRIPQRKHLIKKYGFKVVNHNINLLPACSLRCNAILQERPWDWEALALDIKKVIDNKIGA